MRYMSIAMICLTTTLVFPTAGASQSIAFTRRELRSAMQSAHTANDYARLARFFQERSIFYTERSAEQARILKRDLEYSRASTKYPAPDVSTRRFHEYYADQARQARDLSERYQRLEREALEPQGSVKGLN